MAIAMSKILSCSVKECAYNVNDKCHTLAITVGDGSHPACDTYCYSKNQAKGGAPDVTGGVGACKTDACKFNKSFECAASGINVGPHGGHADCRTFAQR
ncbi:MAG: DUF1540 domain-containing protein [Deltaproteobacteria bacterium]|nr:DUF1540 domain-containing protein [Deltaproteobacteria bacterium]